jgi:hypothetical protein
MGRPPFKPAEYTDFQREVGQKYDGWDVENPNADVLNIMVRLAADEKEYASVITYAIIKGLDDWKRTKLEELDPKECEMVEALLEYAAMSVADKERKKGWLDENGISGAMRVALVKAVELSELDSGRGGDHGL